jgi:hypothetical protein
MEFNRLTLEFHNNTCYINLKSVEYGFSSAAKFAELLSYPFNDTVTIHYEPERGFNVIEKLYGVVLNDDTQPEILWVANNIDNIIQAAYEDGYGKMLEGPTLRELRNIKIFESEWLILRHREEVELELTTTLSNEQYLKVLQYRQDLRDLPSRYSSLDDVVWPILVI